MRLYADKDERGDIPFYITAFGDKVSFEIHASSGRMMYHTVDRQQVKRICDALSKWLEDSLEQSLNTKRTIEIL